MENILGQSEQSEKSQRKVTDLRMVCLFGYQQNQRLATSLLSKVYARKAVRESEKKINLAGCEKTSDSDCFSYNSLEMQAKCRSQRQSETI